MDNATFVYQRFPYSQILTVLSFGSLFCTLYVKWIWLKALLLTNYGYIMTCILIGSEWASGKLLVITWQMSVMPHLSASMNRAARQGSLSKIEHSMRLCTTNVTICHQHPSTSKLPTHYLTCLCAWKTLKFLLNQTQTCAQTCPEVDGGWSC
jgi:hypothetical protein